MASFLTDLVKPYVEKLINGAITESSYICCFTCIAKDFEDEKARLEVERATFNQQVDIATRGGEDVQANALFWEEQAVDLIQEDTKTKQKCFFGFCCNCIWRYRRGKELANKKEQIKKLIETRKELAIGFPAHLPDVERYSSQHYIPFKSRESKCKELLDALNDDSNYIVGLQGMGGTGKTTLAKEVGKKLKQSKQFTQVIDTTVSFSPDIKKIQDDIAGPLGLKFGDCNESDRPKKLWSRLTDGEKILLILDDVWGDIDFDEIGIPQSDNRKGCSVLVTTRNQLVCNRLGCSSTIQLDLLSEDDAWIMFQRHAGLSKVSAKNLLDRGHKIANECKRLPIAIAAIASSLKGEQRREKWDVALNSLQEHMSIGGVEEDLVDIYKCLKLSYDYLENKKAEELFLLCSVFQEDEEISIKILTRFGIGVGLFGESYNKYNNARNLVVVAKDKLLDSCLLLKTNEGDVKMHDLIREVAQWIANKDQIQVVNFSYKNQKSLVARNNNIKYLSFDGNPMDLCSFRFDGSKLMILIFNMRKGRFEDVPVSFFENIAGLRVLNLRADYQITPLPKSIRSLTNIRSLLVERAKLGDISVLESLQSLETLDLKDCDIDTLPEEIAKLRELRLLNLEDCRIESNNPFEVIERCPSLEELYFCRSFNDFCEEITLPTTLERYHVTDYFRTIYDSSLSKCVSLGNDYLSEATFKHVMQTSEHVSLERIKKGWTNTMPEIVPIDEGMNDLIELHLNDVSQLQYLVDTEHIGSDQVPNVFSKLVVLKLFEMNNLEELCNGPISLDSMDSLEELTIMYCGNLRNLFKGNLNLCNLKTVKIERCSTLVSVLSPSGSLPLLEELNISNCDQLENIFTYEWRDEEILVPKLKVVKIYFCNKLTYIFDKQVKRASLIELELFDVPNFIDIFPHQLSIKGSSNSISKQQVEPIKSNIFSWSPICCYRSKSTKVPQDQPQVCSISTETSSYCVNIWERAQCLSNLSHIMCNIREINLWNLSKIKSVFMLSIAPKMSLESLTIADCDELEHVVVDIGDGSGGNELGNVFPKLKKLNVEDCEKLKYIFGHINASDDHDEDNNEIQLHIPVLKSLKFVKLQSLISLCPKQYHTTFPALKKIELNECSQVDVKSIGDFTFLTSISRYLGSTTIKQFSGNIEHFLALERLEVSKSNVESILCLNEESERQIDLGLQNISLRKLPMMIYLFVGPKNAFALKNLKRITIFRCEKLKIVFSTSVLRCLSQLSILRIEECKELKHIIEDDTKNKTMPNIVSSKTCFPKLKAVSVVKCNKLKSLFPVSICNELPKLNALMIKEANELQEVFETEGDQKLDIPNLKLVAFVNLPSLCHAQGIQFQAIPYCFVLNCQNVSPTLTIPTNIDANHLNRYLGFDSSEQNLKKDVEALFVLLKEESKRRHQQVPKRYRQEVLKQFHQEESKRHNIGSENPSSKATSGDMLTSSQKDADSPIIILSPPFATIEPLTSQNVDVENLHETISLNDVMKVSSTTEEQKVSKSRLSSIASQLPSKGFPYGNEVQATSEHELTFSHENDIYSNIPGLKTKMKQTAKGKQEFVVNVPRLEIPSIANSDCLKETEDRSIEEGSMSETRNEPHIQLVSLKEKGIELSFHHLDLGDSQETTRTNNQEFDLYLHMESAYRQFHEFKYHNNGNKNPNAQTTTKEFAEWIEVQATLGHELTSSQKKIRKAPEAEHKFVENVPNLDMPSISSLPTNSEMLMHEQSMDQQCLMNPQHSLEAINTTYNPSQENNLEGSTSEKTAAATMFTISGSKNESPIQLVIAPKQKGLEISVEEGTTSIHDKNITSSTHPEDGDGKIFIPSFSIVNTKPPATKDVDMGDSQETIAMEDINNLIEEDPLLALEKLLTEQVSISSVRILLQELKTLMDSSSDLDHLVSNQESKSKLISLFHQLNQHQGMLTSDLKDFVEKVQNFFNKSIIKQATSEQVFQKHNQLLDSKTDLMNKLWSAKSTQAHIDSETSTANVQINELSLQIDELRIKLEDLENQRDGFKSVVNKCDVQKKKLKVECTEWAQQSKDLMSALASSKVDVREAERARSLEKEGFANLKSLFPTF